MFDALETIFPNNYVRFLIILALVFLVLKLSIFIIEKLIMGFTKKTKTDRDDKFFEKSSKPFMALIFLIGLKISITELGLSESISLLVNRIIYSSMIISTGFIIYYFVDIILFYIINKKVDTNNSSAKKSLISLLQGIFQATVIVIVLLYILEVFGIEIGPFLAAAGIAGLAIALALQPALGNIFSGVSIILDKFIKVGDWVSLEDGTMGKIHRVGLRSTQIITFDNELMIIPNTKLADGRIHNIAEPEPKSRVVIPFSVAYGSNIEKVKKIVLSEIKLINNFVADPEPSVRFLEMADSSLVFKAYFYVNSYENRLSAIDEANTRIYNALNKNKIPIPFQQLDVHIKKK